MRTRGKGLKKEIWFSICSRHAIYDENCNMCNTGSWVFIFWQWQIHKLKICKNYGNKI